MLGSNRISYIERTFNGLELTGIILMLVMTFVFQIVFNELPCPLCILQRIGCFGVALGFLLNLRFGLRPSHYSIALLSALFTSFVALRQVALHVIPGSGTYGDAIFGLHLYTWSFIVSMLIVGVTILMMGIDRQYLSEAEAKNIRMTRTANVLFLFTASLLIANIVSIYLECGLAACPDNPVHYLHTIK